MEDLQSGSAVYSHRADVMMIPASLSKIPTAMVALNRLGPSTTFVTQLLADGEVRGGVLAGALVFKGGGDPAFVSESLWVLVNNLVRTGIREIQGGIVIDATLFDDQWIDPSREAARVDRAYDAPVSAASFNWNSVNVFIRPGLKSGDSAQVYLDPVRDRLSLLGQVQTVGGSGKDVAVSRVRGPTGDSVQVSGRVGVHAQEVVEYKSVSNPVDWVALNLMEFCQQRGIKVSGAIRSGSTPRSAVELARVESQPVKTAVDALMKYSNNFVAEMLTKHISVQAGKTPGSILGGVQVIREDMTKWGGLSEDSVFVNPAGLTRENRLSGKQLVKLLRAAEGNFSWGPEFVGSLPVAGRDGTLKSRQRGIAGRVRAKTGLLTGVVGLAGYIHREDGRVWVFSLMYNGTGGARDGVVRDAFDEISQVLAGPK